MKFSISQLLIAAVFAAGANGASFTNEGLVARATNFRDDFETFNINNWRCEYDCPVIETGKARFRIKSGVEPDNYGSWSKARYTPSRFTSGSFTVRFSLTARPTTSPVWWGVALWDDGVNGRFNEINFGYTTDQSYTNGQLRFESAKEGVDGFLKIDTGIDLYDEEYHNATLEYDSSHVSFFFDGKLMGTITNKTTAPMDLLLGLRLVTGGKPLTTGFTQSVDWVEIKA